jgi:DNA-binding Lrp family transcriptional regulator
MRRKKTTTATAAPTERRPDIYFNGNLEDFRTKLNQVNQKHDLTYFSEWAGFKNVDKAINAITNGENEVLEKYLKKAKELNIVNTETAAKVYTLQTEGMFFDINAVINEQPEQWYFETETPNVGQQEIFIDITASHKVEENDFFKKFQYILNFIDNLERNGTRTKINVGAYNARPSKNNGNLFLNVTIKNYEEPVNLQLFTTLFCTPLFLRFALCGLSSEINGQTEAGAYRTDPTADKVGEVDGKIYIPSVYYDKANGINYTKTIYAAYKLNHLINNN